MSGVSSSTIQDKAAAVTGGEIVEYQNKFVNFLPETQIRKKTLKNYLDFATHHVAMMAWLEF